MKHQGHLKKTKKHKKNKREKKSKTTDVFNKKRIRGERNPKILGQKLKASKGSKKKKGSKLKENLSCFAEIGGEEGTAAKKLGW